LDNIPKSMSTLIVYDAIKKIEILDFSISKALKFRDYTRIGHVFL